MMNTSLEVDLESKKEVIEKFVEKLRRSRYNKVKIRDIIQSGITGYKKKWEPMRDRHRRAEETEGDRRLRKLLGRAN